MSGVLVIPPPRHPLHVAFVFARKLERTRTADADQGLRAPGLYTTVPPHRTIMVTRG